MTTKPEHAVGYLNESVEFRCGSNAKISDDNDMLVPVDWIFSGEKNCIYCMGVLTYAFIGRYSVDDKSIVGEYTLKVENIEKNDEGIYTCIDQSGFGPEEMTAMLVVVGKALICGMSNIS